MFFWEGHILNLEAVILENVGKDIYIGIEILEHCKRKEMILKNYFIATSEGRKYSGEDTAFLFSKQTPNKGLKIAMKAQIERWCRLFDMIDIEARYQKYFYHIYIMNCISIQNSCLFMNKQQVSSEWKKI